MTMHDDSFKLFNTSVLGLFDVMQAAWKGKQS